MGVLRGPDDERLRRAREQADRLRAEAAVERKAREPGREGDVAAGSTSRGRVVGGDLAGPLAILEAAGWRVLHDVRRRLSPLARLDHVCVGPQGVAAVQQVLFEGVVAVQDGVLLLNAASQAFETRQVAAAATALRGVLPPEVPLRTVLCVVPSGPAGPAGPAVTTVRPGVDVVGRAGLATLVGSGAVVLGPDDVGRVEGLLRSRLRTGDGLRRPRFADRA